jgi:hypothetical protein
MTPDDQEELRRFASEWRQFRHEAKEAFFFFGFLLIVLIAVTVVNVIAN